MRAPGPGWLGANQRYLMAVLDGLRSILADHTARQRGATSATGALPDTEALARAMTPPPALAQVCAAFDLSPFERDVLMLCAGVELDGAFASYCAAAQGDRQRTAPTFGLALAALPGAHWSALTPGAPLRRWGLVEPAPGVSLTTSPLRIDERVLHHLAGIPDMDARLRGLADPLPPPARLTPSHAALGDRVAAALEARAPSAQGLAVFLAGPDRAARRAAAAAAGQATGRPVARLHARDLSWSLAERETFLRLWEREARLTGAVLLLECDDADPTDLPSVLVPLAERMRGPVIVSAREPLPLGARAALRMEVNRPSGDEQRGLWLEALGADAMGLGDRIDRIAASFALDAPEIEAVAAQAVAAAAGLGPEALGQALWHACRAQGRARLDSLAQRIVPAADWQDLELPDAERRMLGAIAAHARQRGAALATRGAARTGARGSGTSALLVGPGTTMAAEVLAAELDLDLYRVDLDRVVGRSPGETEKNLRRVFDAAEGGGAVLLVDEVDAVLGRGGARGDGGVRPAGAELGALLRRVEQHRGLTILAATRSDFLSPAALSRLSFVVRFMGSAGVRGQAATGPARLERSFPDSEP